MPLLTFIPEPGDPLLIGDLVHLTDTARPVSRRCCPALITRVMALNGHEYPPLQLEEHVFGSGNGKAQHPSGGWLHSSEASEGASWHLRAECPDGR